MILWLIGMLSSVELTAHEFMHTSKTRRVSVHKIKEQAAREFSEQLRLSAELVQQLGKLQVLYQAQSVQSDLAEEIEHLKVLGIPLYRCRSFYEDILGEAVLSRLPLDQKNMPFAALCGYLTQTVGAIQQRIITYLQDVFEDKGTVFIKEHANRLPDVLKTVTLYTQDFKALSEALCSAIKKLCAIQPVPVPPCKEPDLQTSMQKA